MDTAPSETPANIRQARLFRIESALTQRFGADYFANLPTGPGVYFFSDRAEQLLYIGQSASLRARIGSYRHVAQERHPRRTLRLVARIHRIEWELCATPAEAIERERVLLLEKRPPFNRAGVWVGDPWWLSGEVTPTSLRLRLDREKRGIGPFPPSFRYVFASLARCLYRATLPGQPMHLYPRGLMGSGAPVRISLPLPFTNAAWELFHEAAAGRVERLLELFDALPTPTSIHEEEFWLSERDRLVKYGAKMTGHAGFEITQSCEETAESFILQS